MPKQSSLNYRLIATIVVVLIAAFIALPVSVREIGAKAIRLLPAPQAMTNWVTGHIVGPRLHLGLDLAGGTQLDFRISEEEIRNQITQIQSEIDAAKTNGASSEDVANLQQQLTSVQDQHSNLTEAIRNVIERRINSLGVSETVITPSYVGDEKHLLVECPGVVDVQECIRVVGKTIQLEFKEQKLEVTDEDKKIVRAKAADTVRRMSVSGTTLVKEGEDLGTQLGMIYKAKTMLLRDQLPTKFEDLWNLAPGKVVMREGEVDCSNLGVLDEKFLTQNCVGDQGQFVDKKIPAIFLAETLGPRTQTGRLLNEASKAFQYLKDSEEGLTYATKQDTALDSNVDSRVSAVLQGMTPGDLKTVSLDGSAKVLFLQQLTPGGEKVKASNILVAYAGASQADRTVTRTKEQALARIQDLKRQLDAGANFEALARSQSDGVSKNVGGSMGLVGHGELPAPIDQAIFSQKPGEISAPIETPFGFHLVRVDAAAAMAPTIADYEELTITGDDAATRGDDIIKRLQNGEVRKPEEAIPARLLVFSLAPTGWKDTQLDGKHFRSASVVFDPTTGVPVVQIMFDAEGGKLFQELTRDNVGKPIAIFVGGDLVSAPRVNQEITGGTAIITGSGNIDESKKLAQDLNTGAIPAPIYLTGQYSVEATLGESALHSSLMAAGIGIFIIMIYMIFMYRFLGVIADGALIIYALLLSAILKLPLFLIGSDYIVLTLAGMAGIILSIGMAVDANVLVFERMKEELRRGKGVKSAVEASFTHAWPAIRDGNIATLITCSILFLIGTSIVRGFAITLAMGVALSLFTAVVISRWMLRHMADTELAKNTWLFGGPKNGSSL